MSYDENEEPKTPKMHRLGDPEPVLKRFHPLSEDGESPPTVEELEEIWAEEGEPETPIGRRISTLWVSALSIGVVVTILVVAKWRGSEPPAVEPHKPAPLFSSIERRAQIEERLNKFFGAGSAEGRLPYVLEPNRVRSMIVEYDSRALKWPAKMAKIDEIQFVRRFDHPWCAVVFSDSDDRQYFAGMKETADGYKLDWESMVAYGELDWPTLLSTRPETPVQMRVYLTYTDYRNFKYADAERYIAFKIEHRDVGPELYGFAERGTRTHGLLLAVVPPGMRQPVNVRLRFEPDAGAENLAIIDEVIHRQWSAPSITAPEALD